MKEDPRGWHAFTRFFFPCVEQLNGFSIYHFDYYAYTFKLKDIYVTNLSIYTENTSW